MIKRLKIRNICIIIILGFCLLYLGNWIIFQIVKDDLARDILSILIGLPVGVVAYIKIEGELK